MIQSIRALDRVLRGDATRPSQLQNGMTGIPLLGMSGVIALLAMFYGLCMGVYALATRWGTPKVTDGLLQIVSSGIKTPSLLILTLIVTGPSLYVFNALLGSRLRVNEAVKLLAASIGVLTAVLASFGTIIVFFSLCTESYSFIVLLNVLLFGIAGVLGLGFLLQTLHRLAMATLMAPPVASEGGEDPGPLDRPLNQPDIRSVRRIFRIWVIVFGLIGAQMSWVMRPFVLAPGSDFVVFRNRESNFFQAVMDRFGNLFEETTRSKK